jgi:hypothetical protein
MIIFGHKLPCFESKSSILLQFFGENIFKKPYNCPQELILRLLNTYVASVVVEHFFKVVENDFVFKTH